MPSAIEMNIAETVKHLRDQHYPVFPEDVLKWTAEVIEGTIHKKYFKDGTPTHNWYSGWLCCMEFLTCHLSPLEQTYVEWYNAENMQIYFNVSKGVLLKAGVAVFYPDFDLEVPYS